MNGTGDVAIGGVKGLQGCAAGKFDLLEAELAKLFFLYFADDTAIAFNAGSTKSSQSCSSFFLWCFLLSGKTGGQISKQDSPVNHNSPYDRLNRTEL